LPGPWRFDIDRASPVPPYFQVAQQLQATIEGSRLASGQRLDNELELAERVGVSRPTIRQAIQYLVDKGMLVRQRGVGTLEVRNQVRRSVALSSLYDDLTGAGRRPRTAVLVAQAEVADEPVALALRVPAGCPVVRLERLRYANDEPMALLHNWLPADLADLSAGLLQAHGLYELLRSAGVRLRVATQRIGARAAGAAEAKLLRTRRGAPLLTMARTTYDDTGRAVEYGTHVYRSEVHTFEIALVER